jgi:GTP-binding protein
VLNQAELEKEKGNFSTEQFSSEYRFLISGLTENNLEQLTKKIIQLFPSSEQTEPAEENQPLNLLLFGPPNSGKSTLMNYLLQKNRSLVTPVAGTTKEPVLSQ